MIARGRGPDGPRGPSCDLSGCSGEEGDITVSGSPEDTIAWLAVWAAVHERRVTRRFLLSACPPGDPRSASVVDGALSWLTVRGALRRGLLGWTPGPDALAVLSDLSVKVHGGAPASPAAPSRPSAPPGGARHGLRAGQHRRDAPRGGQAHDLRRDRRRHRPDEDARLPLVQRPPQVRHRRRRQALERHQQGALHLEAGRVSAPYGRAPSASRRLAAVLTDEPATARQLAAAAGMTRQEACVFLGLMVSDGTALLVPRRNAKAANRYARPAGEGSP